MRFRLTVHRTTSGNKYAADTRYEYFGSKEAILELWFLLTKTLKEKHVEVFSLDGRKQLPELGLHGMSDYSI